MDTLLFQGLVERATDEDELDESYGHPKQEVLSSKSHTVVLFLKEQGDNFFPPSLPPRRAERGLGSNCRRPLVIVDAGQY